MATILFVSPSFYPAVVYGGPIHSSYGLCNALIKKNIDILVYTTDAGGTIPLAVIKNKITTLETGLKVIYYKEQIRNYFSIQFFLHLPFKIYKSDVVHIQSIFSAYAFWGLLWSKLLNKPILLSPRGSLGAWCLNQGNSFKKHFLNWFINPFVPLLTFDTASIQESQQILELYPSSKIVILPNGVDLAEFKLTTQAWEKDYYLTHFTRKTFAPNTKVVVSIARLHHVKGLDILINAFHLLKKEHSDIVLLLAGPDAGAKDALIEQVISLDLLDSIFFTGEILGAEKVQFLAGADVFALPSHHENFGIVYLEALAAGIPVVASNATPWEDLEKNELGHWTDLSADSFANAINGLLDAKNEQFSQKAKQYAAKYNWNEIAGEFSKVYQNLIQTRSPERHD